MENVGGKDFSQSWGGGRQVDIITVDIKIIKSHEVRKIFLKILKQLTCIRRFDSEVLLLK